MPSTGKCQRFSLGVLIRRRMHMDNQNISSKTQQRHLILLQATH